jgi:hypothetical protein
VRWQDKVLSDVRTTGKHQHRGRTAFGKDLKPLQFACTVAFVVQVNRAAMKMGVNRSTYVRRAIAVVTAGVLDLDVRVLLSETPVAMAWGAPPPAPRLRQQGLRDTGEGIEAYCPHPGCTGEHFTAGLP